MKPLLTFTSKGIFCEQGDFFIDPWRPVDRAIITHAHADHAKWGHKRYLAHHKSLSVLKQRLGSIQVAGKAYGEVTSINGVKVTLLPAGHIVGSAQIRVEYKGEVWGVSGDYKLESDPLADDFEPVVCNTFITECTFGLPVYKWPEPSSVIAAIERWWRDNQNAGKVSLLSAYALGKAQRVLSSVDSSIGRIFCHGAVDTVNKVLHADGMLSRHFDYLAPETSKKDLEGSLVIAPPSAIGSSWANKLKPYSVGTASGWMMLRGSKRRQNVDRGFILSDHADWEGLNKAIEQTGAERIICTHGYTDTFSEWLKYRGFEAYAEQTIFEGENPSEEAQ